MPPSTPDLRGLRILVVEDTFLIAEHIADELQACGCSVIGPAPRVAEGLALALAEALDGALLDVNLAGERCFPIADALTARHVPFVFLTGYGESLMPAHYIASPRLAKPFAPSELMRMVARCFAHNPGTPPN